MLQGCALPVAQATGTSHPQQELTAPASKGQPKTIEGLSRRQCYPNCWMELLPITLPQPNYTSSAPGSSSTGDWRWQLSWRLRLRALPRAAPGSMLQRYRQFFPYEEWKAKCCTSALGEELGNHFFFRFWGRKISEILIFFFSSIT